MRIELVQRSCMDCNIEANLTSALTAIHSATPQTDLLIFPELYLSGFPTQETIAVVARPLDSALVHTLIRACNERQLSIAIGFAEASEGQYFNTTALLTPDGVAMTYRKTHLWASDSPTFTAGDRFLTCMWQGLRIGILICYDIEFPETAWTLASLDADVLLVTNGNMDPYGYVHRQAILARAMENQVFAVMVNRCGTGDGLTFAGGSCVVDPLGRMVVECGRQPQQIAVDLDISLLQTARRDYHYLAERRVAFQGTFHELPNRIREFRIKELQA